MKNTFEILDQQWAEGLQAGISEYIDTLIYGAADYEDGAEEPETESGIPFCGCDVCYWREILAYATVRILEAQEDGKIALVRDSE